MNNLYAENSRTMMKKLKKKKKGFKVIEGVTIAKLRKNKVGVITLSLHLISQRYSHCKSVVLERKQTHRPKVQNYELRYKPIKYGQN